MGDVWEWISAAAVAGAMLFGLPVLLRGGRRSSRRQQDWQMRSRGGYRVRVGPGFTGLLGLALLRRMDAVAPPAAAVAVIVLAIVNARSST